MELDGAELDRYITGNYGEDQFDLEYEYLCQTLCNDCDCVEVCKWVDDEPMKCKRFKEHYASLKDRSYNADEQYERKRDMMEER